MGAGEGGQVGWVRLSPTQACRATINHHPGDVHGVFLTAQLLVMLRVCSKTPLSPPGEHHCRTPIPAHSAGERVRP